MPNKMFQKLKYFNTLTVRQLHFEDDEFGDNKRLPLPSATQLLILNFLLDHRGESVGQHDIEEKLNLSAPTTSTVLSTMETRGLIKRDVSKDDERAKTITLTKDAENHFKHAQHEFGRLRAKATRGISPREQRNFEKILDKMIENLSDEETEEIAS